MLYKVCPMKLNIFKQNPIYDLFTWFKYAEPEGGESQWKEGRSALEFARYMTYGKGNVPQEVETYLKSIGISGDECSCQPEYITPYEGYDLGKGGGRHHDAIIHTEDAVIGIEAKVSESFDKSISEKLSSATKNSDSGKNMKKRIMSSIKLIKGVDYSDSVAEVNHLMYQLISATVGTLIEADKANVNKAVVLVLEFVGDVDFGGNSYKNQMENNAKAFNDFISFLGIKDEENAYDDKRKISCDINGRTIDLWFKKMSISISKDDYSYSLK